jgi:hypothetical protein
MPSEASLALRLSSGWSLPRPLRPWLRFAPIGKPDAQRHLPRPRCAAYVAARWVNIIKNKKMKNPMSFETIAIGGRIRDIMRIQKQYGPGRWRKLKGFAKVRLHVNAADAVNRVADLLYDTGLNRFNHIKMLSYWNLIIVLILNSYLSSMTEKVSLFLRRNVL